MTASYRAELGAAGWRWKSTYGTATTCKVNPRAAAMNMIHYVAGLALWLGDQGNLACRPRIAAQEPEGDTPPP